VASEHLEWGSLNLENSPDFKDLVRKKKKKNVVFFRLKQYFGHLGLNKSCKINFLPLEKNLNMAIRKFKIICRSSHFCSRVLNQSFFFASYNFIETPHHNYVPNC
jgi:hypothetical protein